MKTGKGFIFRILPALVLAVLMQSVFISAALAGPLIQVECSTGTALANPDTLNFGSAVSGGNSTVSKECTIKNTGDTALTINSVAVLTGGSEYSITTPPDSSVEASSTTTFVVKFAPLSCVDPRIGAILIDSDDDSDPPDPSPNANFAINLTGTGTAPTVTSVSSTTTDGTYGTGTVIPITVTFSGRVNVDTTGGTPRLTLQNGSGSALVSYSSGTETATLTFNYTVAAGDNSADLDYVAGSLVPLGGTIQDVGSSSNAVLTLPTPGDAGSLGANKDIVIDTTSPTVTSVSSTTTNGTYGTGSSIDVTVTFNETVNVTGAPTLTLETGTTYAVATYTSGSGSATLTFTYAVVSGNTSADLDYVAATPDPHWYYRTQLRK